MKHSARILALQLVFLCVSGAAAQETAEPNTSSGQFERDLELSRHERLHQVRSDPDSVLQAFSTDGCSGGLSAAWPNVAAIVPAFAEVHGGVPPWESCCIEHDRHYHRGGETDATPAESFEARRQADLELRTCVIEIGAERGAELARAYGLTERQTGALYEVIAELMYRAVRLGGVPCTALPWRWGYGWPPCVGVGP